MFDIENDCQKQSDNSTNSNSENDFKELDNEIGKVVRGETSFEEEKLNYNSDEDSNSNSKNIQNESNSQDEKKINLDKNDNLDKSKLINILYQLQQENLIALENYKKNLLISMMNSQKAQYNYNFNNSLKFNNIANNSNLNGYISNLTQNDLKSNNNNSFFYNNMNNLDKNNRQINNNSCQNMNNIYLNELISLYNDRFNNCNNNINNQNDINFININNLINKLNNCIYNTNVNFNINSTSLPILNNNLLNFYSQREMQDNILFNNKVNPSLFNNFYNNNMNNINHNYDSLIFNNLQMQLLKDNLNNSNSNLLLLNQIYNKNRFNVNINNNSLEINKNSNITNNQSQIDFNVSKINGINKIDNKIKNKNNNNPFLNINKNMQKNLDANITEDNSKFNYKKKAINQKLDLDKNKNIINLFDVLFCKDRRTTLMIKNIPNKYTISSFLEEINVNFKFTYDIFYLPIDYINKCNLGFAFINFVEPFHIILFYELYRGKKWKKFNSDKICELLYAKFQGKKELIAHFEKGKVLSMESEEKRPLILPTPNPLPKINLPLYYLELFIKIYPNISYEIKECKNNKNNNNGNKKNFASIIPIFSIKGNFH